MLKKLLIFAAEIALTLDYGAHAIPALDPDRNLLEITKNGHKIDEGFQLVSKDMLCMNT